MWAGIALVALSVVAGARIVGAADDTVRVWSAAEDLAAGEVLTAETLTATSVHFAERADLDRYFLVDEQLPSEVSLARSVGAGELVPRAALSAAGADGVSTLPLVLPGLAVPPELTPGTRVDVWSVNERGDRYRAEIVLADVEVVGVPAGGDGFGATLERQVLLGVGPDQQDAVAKALAAAADGTLTLQKRG